MANLFAGGVMTDKKSGGSFKLPLLPLRDVIVFPHMVIPLFVGREKSIRAIEESSKNNQDLFLVTQKDASILNPDREDIYDVGTVATIIQLLRLPDNTLKVLIEGKHRGVIENFESTVTGHFATVSKMKTEESGGNDLEAIIRGLKSSFEEYVKHNKKLSPEIIMGLSSIYDPARLADVMISHLTIKISDKQEVLGEANLTRRLNILLEKMQSEIEVIQVEKKIRTRVKSQMERSQKEYYLNEQMNAIQRELGNRDDKSEVRDFEERLEKKEMPEEAKSKVRKEIKKIKALSPVSAESAVSRNYVDWMLSLPWGEYSEEIVDLKHSEEILDEDHFGLKDVKERILEYLAVKKLAKGEEKGTILCLAGPPGVGKTSIAKSLAKSLNRNFVRISLGGLRDEAEIRGHRRTYVGAMPGKVLQALKRAQKSNPLILLDEIDKMGSDYRGDPSSAMLEVLDPEQNKTFNDHYIEADYDLSKVMFIMTANDLSQIPLPLRDRMEIIQLSGYTPQEKMHIAKDYLVSKALRQNGLKELELSISDKVILKVVQGYTREAGVRDLERTFNKLARKLATKVVREEIDATKKFNCTEKKVTELLGPLRFEKESIEDEAQVGLVNGLAWTSVGGTLLQIEVLLTPGNGKLQYTGKLGEVMQESVKASLSFVRSIGPMLGIAANFFDVHDLHIHIPEGATPKDGPSAGITLVTAITSAVGRIPVRQDVAMTGEVTLRGKVLPIGGLKEKILAAKLSGVKKVIIPWQNKKDLLTMSSEILSGLEIVACQTVQEVLREALEVEDPVDFLNVIKLKVVPRQENNGLEVAN